MATEHRNGRERPTPWRTRPQTAPGPRWPRWPRWPTGHGQLAEDDQPIASSWTRSETRTRRETASRGVANRTVPAQEIEREETTRAAQLGPRITRHVLSSVTPAIHERQPT